MIQYKRLILDVGP